MNVSLDGLSDALKTILGDYGLKASKGVKEQTKKAADNVKKDISSSAPRDTGGYSKSWAVKKTEETAMSVEYTVHSRNKYQLAHLLEFGHAKRGGGRVSAQPHIAKAAEKGEREYLKNIERVLRDG